MYIYICMYVYIYSDVCSYVYIFSYIYSQYIKYQNGEVSLRLEASK